MLRLLALEYIMSAAAALESPSSPESAEAYLARWDTFITCMASKLRLKALGMDRDDTVQYLRESLLVFALGHFEKNGRWPDDALANRVLICRKFVLIRNSRARSDSWHPLDDGGHAYGLLTVTRGEDRTADLSIVAQLEEIMDPGKFLLLEQRHIEGYSPQEIAEDLGLKPLQVSKRLYRAHVQARQHLKRLGVEGVE